MKNIKLSTYLTVQQAALESRKSEGLLRKRIQDHKLMYLKIGHSVLIPREEIEKIKLEKDND